MNATVQASPADEHAIIRLENGATIDSRDGVHKTWAPGGHLIYEGVSISRALAVAVEVKPRRQGGT